MSSRFELLTGSQGPNKSLLDEIVRLCCIFGKMERHPIQMIEMDHSLGRKSVAPGARYFSLLGHWRILTNCGASV